MANHASAIKRIRTSKKKRSENRYQHKTAKTYIKRLQKNQDPAAAVPQLKKITSMLDKLVKKKIIHPNKSARKKAKLAHYVNGLVKKNTPKSV